jgi:hypothetical protein
MGAIADDYGVTAACARLVSAMSRL